MADIKQEFEKIYSQYYDFIYKFLIKNVGGKQNLQKNSLRKHSFRFSSLYIDIEVNATLKHGCAR